MVIPVVGDGSAGSLWLMFQWFSRPHAHGRFMVDIRFTRVRTVSLAHICLIHVWDLAGSSRRTFVAFLRLEATQELQLHKCDIWDASVSFPRRRLTERSWQVFVSFPRAAQRDPCGYLCNFRGQGLTESSWQTWCRALSMEFFRLLVSNSLPFIGPIFLTFRRF